MVLGSDVASLASRCLKRARAQNLTGYLALCAITLVYWSRVNLLHMHMCTLIHVHLPLLLHGHWLGVLLMPCVQVLTCVPLCNAAILQEVQGRQAAEDRARVLEEELLHCSEMLQEATRAAKALTVTR
jgi:hypothetical protein